MFCAQKWMEKLWKSRNLLGGIDILQASSKLTYSFILHSTHIHPSNTQRVFLSTNLLWVWHLKHSTHVVPTSFFCSGSFCSEDLWVCVHRLFFSLVCDGLCHKIFVVSYAANMLWTWYLFKWKQTLGTHVASMPSIASYSMTMYCVSLVWSRVFLKFFYRMPGIWRAFVFLNRRHTKISNALQFAADSHLPL